MKIATAAYPLDLCRDFTEYAEKQINWVREAAQNGADLLVFPEYARMELAGLAGAPAAADLEASLHAANAYAEDADALIASLAEGYGVHILAGSGPVFTEENERPVNQASLFGPDGYLGQQDKQVMTRFEREKWDVVAGEPLEVIETDLGKIGILICYDAEFPLLGRALVEQGAEILLCPSCTDSLAGYNRVRIGAMARALEGQCVTVQSPTVGAAHWSPAVDESVGIAGVYGPPDLGFPATGILAEGPLNTPGWTYAEVEVSAIARVRQQGAVFNHAHWPESHARARHSRKTRDLP